MFCEKCGAQIPDDSAFCTVCGAKIEATAEAAVVNETVEPVAEVVDEVAAEPVEEEKANEPVAKVQELADTVMDVAKKKPLYLIIGAAAIVLTVILCVVLFGGRSYKSVIKKSINATYEADAKAFVKLFPDKVIEFELDEKDMTKKQFIEDTEDMLELTKEFMDERYDKWSVSHKIIDTEDFSKKELREIQNEYEDEYDLKVKDAKTITVKITIKGDGEEESTKREINVIKIGRSWYLAD